MRSRKVNPFDRKMVKDDKTAVKNTNKSVKPVAKDTTKTRRKCVKPTKGNIDG